MPAGKGPTYSKIVEAIARAEESTTSEIRVHLSRRWIEPDSLKRAQRLFHRFGMSATQNRNAILLYVNLRRHRFAIFGDHGVHEKFGQEFWNSVTVELAKDLRSTHPERAIAEAVSRIGHRLAEIFPIDPQSKSHHSNELPNDISVD